MSTNGDFIAGKATAFDGHGGRLSRAGVVMHDDVTRQAEQPKTRENHALPAALGVQSPNFGGYQPNTSNTTKDCEKEESQIEIEKLRASNKQKDNLIASLRKRIKAKEASDGDSARVSNLRTMMLDFQKRAKQSRQAEAKKKTCFVRGQIAGSMRKKVTKEIVMSMRKLSDRNKYKDQELFDVATAVAANPGLVNWNTCKFRQGDIPGISVGFELISNDRIVVGGAHPAKEARNDLTNACQDTVDYLCENDRVSDQGKQILLGLQSEVEKDLNIVVRKQERKAGRLLVVKRAAQSVVSGQDSTPSQSSRKNNKPRKRRRHS